jgi:hypothetical protein
MISYALVGKTGINVFSDSRLIRSWYSGRKVWVITDNTELPLINCGAYSADDGLKLFILYFSGMML